MNSAKEYRLKCEQAAKEFRLKCERAALRQLLRNMRRLTPLFDGLQHYSKSIEAACEGTPYMAWIWAPIKLILKVWDIINCNRNQLGWCRI